MCKTLTLVLTLFALLTPACSVPFYDLDAIAILGPTVAVDQATQAVARLGGVIGNGHTIVFDEQMAYCGKTATAETLAVASTMNVHLCPAYRTSSPSTQRRAVWHELPWVTTPPPPPPPPVVGSGLSVDTGTLPRKIVTGCEPGS